jgi:hypothetical protein
VCSGSPTKPEHGAFECPAGSLPGTKCDATCEEGYTAGIGGAPAAVCSSSGSWGAVTGNCTQIVESCECICPTVWLSQAAVAIVFLCKSVLLVHAIADSLLCHHLLCPVCYAPQSCAPLGPAPTLLRAPSATAHLRLPAALATAPATRGWLGPSAQHAQGMYKEKQLGWSTTTA